MDGNGRWATARHLPRSAGHKMGAKAAEKIIRVCPEQGIQHLTLYTFSYENWNRPEKEVSDLMNLLRLYLDNELKTFHKNGVRLKVIGDLEKLPADIRKKILEAERITKDNKNLNLNIALSYGSKQEILHAMKNISKKIEKGEMATESITLDVISNNLYTNNIPDPDLLIRTGGNHRISNFLLWQLAYAELYFTDTLWPDFTAQKFIEAIEDFKQRDRRFGLIEEQEAI
jgi:undecaprenyl diphosphate synthase